TASNAPAASAPAASAPAASQAAPELLQFQGKTIDGKAFSGTSLAGKPVVFWFWAPWCPKCMSEGPNVAKAMAKYDGKVAFVGVGGLDDSQDELKRFVSRTGTSGVTHLDDRDGKLYKHFKVTTQSSFVFMTTGGDTSKASGPLDESALNGHIDKLIG
ncbi:redoxin domain-containing protein, partial [Actinomadura adrarensis]